MDKKNLIGEFNFLHFNDVYNITEKYFINNISQIEPVGGASRFVAELNKIQEDEKALTFFSGDIFAPSLCILNSLIKVSTIFKGEQLIPIIDELNIDVACVGNHDYVI